MTDFRNFSPRPFLALLAGFALAFGMVAPHDLAVEQAGPASRVSIAETAIHPGAPQHCEAAKVEVHRGCTACLMQLGSSTVLGRPLVPLPALLPCGGVAASAAQAFSAEPSLLSPARAPPVSSLFA